MSRKEPPDIPRGQVTDLNIIRGIFYYGWWKNRPDYTAILKRVIWPKPCLACKCEWCKEDFKALISQAKVKCATGSKTHHCGSCLSWMRIKLEGQQETSSNQVQ